MRSRVTHWFVGLAILTISGIWYTITAGTLFPALELLSGSMALLGILAIIIHPRTGAVDRKLFSCRLLVTLAGASLLIGGVYAAVDTDLWLLPMVFAVSGGFMLYASLFKISWTEITTRLTAFRKGDETVQVIVPDDQRYWGYFVVSGTFILVVSSVWHGLFPPENLGSSVIFTSMFLFGLLLMFGSPLSGSVEQTLLVYKGLFAVAGLGLLFGGVYPLVTEGSILSGVVAPVGFFLLYFGFGKISWEFMREVVEEYRTVEHPSTLGAEGILERVQERWDDESTEKHTS